MDPAIIELLNDIPDVGVVYKEPLNYVSVVEGVQKTLNECYTEYLTKVAYDDHVYQRFIATLRLLRKPMNTKLQQTHQDSIGTLIHYIKEGLPMSMILHHFEIIMRFAINVKEPLIALQRRSFRL